MSTIRLKRLEALLDPERPGELPDDVELFPVRRFSRLDRLQELAAEAPVVREPSPPPAPSPAPMPLAAALERLSPQRPLLPERPRRAGRFQAIFSGEPQRDDFALQPSRLSDALAAARETDPVRRGSQPTIGDHFRNAAARFVQGSAEVPASVLMGIAVLAKKLDEEFGTGQYEGKAASELATYKLGKIIRETAAELFPNDPRLQGHFISDVLPQAFGSMLGYLALGGAARAVGASSLATAGAAGVTGQAAGAYEEAKALHGTEEQALRAGTVAAPFGVLEAIPIERAVNRAARTLAGEALPRLTSALAGMGEEAIQEATSQVGHNIALREEVDPTRSLFEGVPEAAGAGAITGAAANVGLEALAEALHRRRVRAAQRQAAQTGQDPIAAMDERIAALRQAAETMTDLSPEQRRQLREEADRLEAERQRMAQAAPQSPAPQPAPEAQAAGPVPVPAGGAQEEAVEREGPLARARRRLAGAISPELRREAEEDPLTGALNKRADTRATERALQRRAPGTRVVRYRVDFDNFKALNDRRGHEAGDQALRVVTEALRAATRPEDQISVGRVGGDEFAITLRISEGADPAAIRDRLEQAADAALEAAGLADLGDRRVGVSIGFAEATEGMSAADLDRAADEAAIARKKERGVSRPRESAAPSRGEAADVEAVTGAMGTVINMLPDPAELARIRYVSSNSQEDAEATVAAIEAVPGLRQQIASQLERALGRTVRVYRAGDVVPDKIQSWTLDPNVARMFARYGDREIVQGEVDVRSVLFPGSATDKELVLRSRDVRNVSVMPAGRASEPETERIMSPSGSRESQPGDLVGSEQTPEAEAPAAPDAPLPGRGERIQRIKITEATIRPRRGGVQAEEPEITFEETYADGSVVTRAADGTVLEDRRPQPAPQPTPAEQPTAATAEAAAASDRVRRLRQIEQEQRLESIWQRLMATPARETEIAQELSPEEARTLLDRLRAAPGTHPAVEAALLARIGERAAPEAAPAPAAAEAARDAFSEEEPLDLGGGRRAYKKDGTWYLYSPSEGRYVAFPNDPEHAGYRVYQAMERRLTELAARASQRPEAPAARPEPQAPAARPAALAAEPERAEPKAPEAGVEVEGRRRLRGPKGIPPALAGVQTTIEDFSGNKITEGPLVSDGKILFNLEKAVGRLARRLAAKPELSPLGNPVGNRFSQETARRVFERAIEDATVPVEILGLSEEKNLDTQLVAHVAPVGATEGRTLATSARRLRLLAEVTRFDELRAPSNPKMQGAALVAYRGGEPVGLITIYSPDEYPGVPITEFVAGARPAGPRPGGAETSPAAEAEEREKRPDGRWVPREGDEVYQTVPGFGGTPASVRGVVIRNRQGELRVRLTEGAQLIGGRQRLRGTVPLDESWTVVGDPEIARRREERDRKEEERRRQIQAESEEQERRAKASFEAALARGEERVTPENARVGARVYSHDLGEAGVITAVDGEDIYVRFDDDPPASGGSFVGMNPRLTFISESGSERRPSAAEMGPEPSSTTAAPSSDLIARLDALENAAKARIAARRRQRGTTLHTFPAIDPDDLADYALVGAVKITKGVVRASEWTRAMIRDFGDEIRPFLDRIRRLAEALLSGRSLGQIPELGNISAEQRAALERELGELRAVRSVMQEYADILGEDIAPPSALEQDEEEVAPEPEVSDDREAGGPVAGVRRGDHERVPGVQEGPERPSQPRPAPSDQGDVEAGEPGVPGAAPRGRDRGRTGVRRAGTDVEGAEAADQERAAGDRRTGAGRADASDAGARPAGAGRRGDRAREGDAERAPGELVKRPETVSPANHSTGNYHIDDPLKIVGGTPVERFNKNKAAIEKYIELRDSGRPPTKEEQDILAGYTGWGSFGQELFQGSWNYPRPKPGWEERDKWLREHLGREEWEGLQRSIINAHYTDPPTVIAMWDMVRRMGFDGGRVLEPAMGIGNFFGLMPLDLKNRSQLNGIELDPVTGGMAKMLYPDANIRVMAYQDSKTPDDFYDLIIGNWPFSETVVADRRYNRLRPVLHDYFFLKAVDQVRPGGIVIGITSAGTLDKKNPTVRREIAKKAELIAAFRLPSGAFEKYAGTNVVTDIIILRKRPEPLSSVEGEGWINTVEVDTPSGQKVRINEYYQAHPDHVVGTIDYGHGTTTGRPGLIVHRPADMEAQLRRIVNLVPEGVYRKDTRAEQIRYITNHTDDREGALVRTDQGFFIVRGEHLAPAEEVLPYRVKNQKETARREAQFDALIQMRRLYGELLESELGRRDADPEEARKRLREAYQAFVKEHGPLNESFGLEYMRRIDDPFYPALAALETADKDGKWRPATILERSTMRPPARIENPSIEDAYVLARNRYVNPSLEQIAAIAKKPPEEVKRRLIEAGAIFETPGGDIVPADIYLSGNVREKLRQAEAALAEGNEAMRRNVEALRKVIPPDVPYFNIEVQMGATWIPTRVYEEYIAHMLNLPSTEGITVSYAGGHWKVTIAPHLLRRTEASTGFGTPHYRFNKLVNAAISNQTVRITEKDPLTGEQYVNQQATDEANAKIAEIREKFGEWLWSDPERRIELEREYNETRNCYADPHFDGSFLNFEGMALQLGDGPFNLRKHQANAIWRALVTRKSLMAHEVGTGKTFTIAGIAIESRRYGIAKKPLVLAHNANSKAVAAAIQQMYPAAKVLYIDNLSRDKIDVRLRQIANDDWDAIVLPHSLLDRLTLKPETLMEMAREEIEALEEMARAAAEEDGVKWDDAMLTDPKARGALRRSPTAKELVKARDRIIETIKAQTQRASREGAIYFEDLGVDMLLVDEVHEFKKPPLASRMKPIKGLQRGTSNKAINLFYLARYIRSRNNGGNVHLFTGTPITNTLVEIFHHMRYIMEDEMKQAGVADFDSWFSSFAAEVADVEQTAAGEYETVGRLRSFINLPELRRMIGQYMDVVFAEDMPEMQLRRTKSGKTLDDPTLTEEERDELLNGRTEGATDRPYKKVIVDIAEPTPEQERIFRYVRKLADSFRKMSPKERQEVLAKGRPESPIVYEGIAARASFDARMANDEEYAGMEGQVPDDPNSKISRAIKSILEIYHSHPLANQVVFTDTGFGTSATRVQRDSFGEAEADGEGKRHRKRVRVFSPVRDMVERLVQAGIPRNEIAIVDGSTSKEKRHEIAEAMNEGRIRIVIGSTDSLGVGVNMQKNLRAMHHLDAPWMPGELEQRNGRGWRQGNQWNTVLEYRYVTERMDGRRWQVLDIKQKFIRAFLRADYSTRVLEGDAASEEPSDILTTFAEASGDPRVLLRHKLQSKIEQLKKRQRAHDQGVADARRRARIERAKRERLEAELRRIDESGVVQAVQDALAAMREDFSMVVGGKRYDDRGEAEEAIQKWIAANLSRGDEGKYVGEYAGHPLFATWPRLELEPHFTLRVKGTDIESGKARVVSLEIALRYFPQKIEKWRKELEELDATIRRLEEVAEQPFARAEELERTQRQLELLEQDLERNPVPPPAWLRQGAPVDTDVVWHGQTFTVTGHRWTKEGWFVIAERPDGSEVSIPYNEVTDQQGMPLYEERPFEPPPLLEDKSDATKAEQAEAEPDAESEEEAEEDPNDIWEKIPQPTRGYRDLTDKYVWHINGAKTIEQLEAVARRLDRETGEIPPKYREALERRIEERRKELRRDAENRDETGPDESTELRHTIGLPALMEAMRSRQAQQQAEILTSSFEEVERRWREAKGIKNERIRNRVGEAIRDVVNSFRRHFPHIDPNASEKHAVFADLMRVYEASPQWAKAVAYDKISEIVEGLSAAQVDLMTRILALRDILRDIDRGLYEEKSLPFGYESREAVELDLARFEAAAEADPKVKAALEKRRKFTRALTERLVALELLPPSVLKDDRYYHRQVMAYFNAQEHAPVGTGSRDVRLKKKGFQKQRTGGSDFNTAYQEAEFEWVSQAYALMARKETLERIRHLFDMTPTLRALAKETNRRRLGEIVLEALRKSKEVPASIASAIGLRGRARLDELTAEEVADRLLKPFRQKIARANGELARLAADGELKSVDGQFADVIEAFTEEVEENRGPRGGVRPVHFDHPRWFAFLAHLLEHDLPGSTQAADIFKAIQQREKFIREVLGREYLTWGFQGEPLDERLIPEGYTLWQPEKGNHFFMALTVPEKVLDRAAQEGRILTRDDVREMLVVGGPKEAWVIPEEVAATLDNFQPTRDDQALEGLWVQIQNTWKQWVLLSPARMVRYNFNNLTGDIDIVLAYEPSIIRKEWKKAARDLWAYYQGKASAEVKEEIQDAIRRGVVGSTLTIAEIPDINRTGAFRVLTSDDPNLAQKAVQRYWDSVKNFTTWRENILRLAAYRHFQKEIAAGRKVYGASSKKQIDALKDPKEKAARLARDLLGDYGNISMAGQWLRRHLIPFYSWIEINAPRYVRLLRNLAYEEGGGRRSAARIIAAGGVGAGIRGSLVFVRGVAKFGLRANLLMLFAALWNHLFFPDEEEELRGSGREPHLILGRAPDGSIRMVRLPGALADALEWFALSDYPADIRDILRGTKDLGDTMAEAVKGPINRVVNAWEPVSKTLFEVALGRSTYPSIFEEGDSFRFRTRPIRDRGEHVARTLALDAIYNRVTGKPKRPRSKGPMGILEALLLYRIDPGEAAYFEIRQRAIDYLRDRGREVPSIQPTERQNALYYFRMAVQWGDEKAAERWLARYYELGGRPQDVKGSVSRAHPLGFMPVAERKRFIAQLSESDREILKQAEKWYRENYRQVARWASRGRLEAARRRLLRRPDAEAVTAP